MSEFVAAGVAVTLVAVLASLGVLVFRRTPVAGTSTLWSLLLSDRATLGFIRLAAIAFAVYSIASIAAMVARGRWIKAFRSGGFEVDDARASDEGVKRLEALVRDTERERDELARLVWGFLSG